MAITRIGLNQSINLASNITGTLPVGNGGTAITSGFINGTAERAMTVADKSADLFFTPADYVGAVKDSTDTWYEDWTVPGSLN